MPGSRQTRCQCCAVRACQRHDKPNLKCPHVSAGDQTSQLVHVLVAFGGTESLQTGSADLGASLLQLQHFKPGNKKTKEFL